MTQPANLVPAAPTTAVPRKGTWASFAEAMTTTSSSSGIVKPGPALPTYGQALWRATWGSALRTVGGVAAGYAHARGKIDVLGLASGGALAKFIAALAAPHSAFVSNAVGDVGDVGLISAGFLVGVRLSGDTPQARAGVGKTTSVAEATKDIEL